MDDCPGEKQKGAEDQTTIYTALGIKRARYIRVLNGDPVRFSKDELRKLMELTGMRREIFEGTDCFKFANISRKDWKGLFDKREKDMKGFREYEKELYNYIKPSDGTLLNNADLYHFIVYLKKGDDEANAIVKKITLNMENVDFIQIEKLDRETLKTYIKGLERQLDIAKTCLH